MSYRIGIWIVLSCLLAACGGESSAPEPSATASDEAAQSAPEAAAAAPPTAEELAQLRLVLANTAKRLCSSVHVSGRSREHVMAEELAAAVDQGVQFEMTDAPATVVARAGGESATVVYRPHLGCTLLRELSVDELLAQFDTAAYPEVVEPGPNTLWPDGSRVVIPDSVPGLDLEAVNTAIEGAFAEPDPENPVRTRAVVVVHDGRVIAERYAQPFNERMPQLGWSMTKTVTNALTGMRVGDGALEREAPAPVPAWQGEDDPRSAITLNHLLHMSSGLEFSEVYLAETTSDVVAMLYGEGAHSMGAYAAAKPLAHEPGTHWSYASGTTNLIAMLLRGTFEDQNAYFAFPRERLFNKLHMASAVLEPDESGSFVGSSYMYASPRDWAKMGLLYLNDGVWNGERLLPEGWAEYSVTPAPAAEQGQYGAQIWLNRGADDDASNRPHPQLPTEMYYLSGFEGQNVVVVPSKRLVVVRMGLTENDEHRPTWQLVRDVLDAFEG